MSTAWLRTCGKSKFYGAFVLNHRVVLHAIDAMPARWRGDADSSRRAPDALVDFHTGSDPAGDVAPRCASTACGVLWGGGCDTPTGGVMFNWKLRRAVRAWFDDAAAAEATYGHISTWDTSLVTDMHCLFAAAKESECWYYNAEAASFDEHLEEWDVSHVDTMWNMFNGAARRGNRPATNAPRTVTSAQAPRRSTKTWATGTCPIPRT